MKSAQRFSIAFSLLIVALMSSGCASNCGCNSGTGLFGTNFLAGQPIRTTVRGWFQGDSCDTCNVPAGQLTQPLVESCPTCVGGGGGQIFGGTQPLYGNPVVGGQPTGFSEPIRTATRTSRWNDKHPWANRRIDNSQLWKF